MPEYSKTRHKRQPGQWCAPPCRSPRHFASACRHGPVAPRDKSSVIDRSGGPRADANRSAINGPGWSDKNLCSGSESAKGSARSATATGRSEPPPAARPASWSELHDGTVRLSSCRWGCEQWAAAQPTDDGA
jgi:hypothetical protein